MPTSRRVVRDILLLVLGASLYTVASPPYEWSSAAWLALSPLFLVLRGKTPGTACVAGLFYGVLFCGGIAYWVYGAIAAYFSLVFPLDLLMTLFSYSLFVGSYTGLAAAYSCVLMRSNRSLLRWVGIPALWVSAEFARTSLFSGFSWELLGYTQYRHLPLIQVADLTGVYGLSFLMALSSYIAAEGFVSLRLFQASSLQPPASRFPWPALACLLGGVALTLLYGTLRLHQYQDPSSPAVEVALVQGSVPGAQRWQRVHYASTLLKYISITRQGVTGIQPDLVVWPEFALGFYLDREPLLRAQLGQLTQSIDTSLLVGAPRIEETETGVHYYNSAYLIGPGGALRGTYDKMRLLPFAEYRPLALSALLPHSYEYPSEFTPGRRSTVFALPRTAFGVTICYEATYPDLTRRLVQGGAQFLVNISNDTWLGGGGSAAAAQHFSMAVFRAVENKRPLVRVATAGVSGFIDPTGRLSHRSGEQEGVIVGEVIPRRETTIYARYGDWFALGCAGVALVALLSRASPKKVRLPRLSKPGQLPSGRAVTRQVSPRGCSCALYRERSYEHR